MNSTQDYDANARLRCERHTGERREACLMLNSPDAVVHGSVQGGGTLREVTIRQVGEPPMSGTTTMPGTMPQGTMPQRTTPQGTMPQGTTPQGTMPQGTVPPSQAVPVPAAPDGMRSGTGLR